MTKKQHRLDGELRQLVRDGVLINNNVSITKLVKLLQKGANPYVITAEDELSASSIILQNNKTGKYNFIVELFDEYANPQAHLRAADSVEEGMSANREYD